MVDCAESRHDHAHHQRLLVESLGIAQIVGVLHIIRMSANKAWSTVSISTHRVVLQHRLALE